MKLGLLMESAQAHQKSAEEQLEKLRVHTDDLDGVVRDEIRRTLIEELQMLTAESDAGGARSCKESGRTSVMRGTAWSVVMAVLCTGIPGAIMRAGHCLRKRRLPRCVRGATNWPRALRCWSGREGASTGGAAVCGGGCVFAWTAARRPTAKRRTTMSWQVIEACMRGLYAGPVLWLP